jgi:hypothetical protein
VPPMAWARVDLALADTHRCSPPWIAASPGPAGSLELSQKEGELSSPAPGDPTLKSKHGLPLESNDDTNAVWGYWSVSPTAFAASRRTVVLDAAVCRWTR